MPPDDTTELTPDSPPKPSTERDVQRTDEPPEGAGQEGGETSETPPASPKINVGESEGGDFPEEDYLFDEKLDGGGELDATEEWTPSVVAEADESGLTEEKTGDAAAPPESETSGEDRGEPPASADAPEERASDVGEADAEALPAPVAGQQREQAQEPPQGKKLGWIGAWKKLRRQRAKEPPGGREQDFMEHLAELRDRIIKIIVLICLGTTLCWGFYDRQIHFVVLEGPQSVLQRCRVYLVSEGKQTPREAPPGLAGTELTQRIAKLEQTVKELQGRIAELERRTGVSARVAERESPSLAPGGASGSPPPKPPSQRKILVKLVLPSLWGFITGPVRKPLEAKGVRTVFQNPLEPLLVRFQVVVVAGIVLLSPAIFYQIWAFVWPALYAHERKAVGPLVPASFVLFALGVALAYKVIPVFFLFLLSFASGDSEVFNFVKWYIPFLAKVCLSMGIVFEMPVVFWIMGKLGIIGAQTLLKYWRHAIVIIFIVAAIITPTWDPFNLCLLAVPICALYFLSVFLVWVAQRGREREEEAG